LGSDLQQNTGWLFRIIISVLVSSVLKALSKMSNYLFLPYQLHHTFYLSPYNLTLTSLIDSLSLRRPELNSLPDNVEIVLDNAALEQVYLGVFWFFRVVTIPAMLHAYYNITGIM